MLKIMHDDTVIKEYEDSAIFIILNNENTELIGSNENFKKDEHMDNVHIALAIHWALAHAPELMANILEAFDDAVTEQVKPVTETVQ